MQESTLLIVDDNPVDRERVERLLKGEYQFLSASSGNEGVEVCRKSRPSCVLLDYRLPDRDGVEWLPSFLEQHVGVIMLTGVGDESVAVASLQGGAHDYLSKSELTRENLERAVRNATEKAQLIREVDLRHQIVAVMPIGVAVFQWLDRSDVGTLRLLWQNAAAGESRVIGRDWLGRTMRDVVPTILDTAVPQLVANTILTGVPQALSEVAIEESVYTVKTAPLGADIAAVLFEDVTAQRRALEDHRKLEIQMRAAQRLETVGRLAGGVAHDFNNVLTVIQNYAHFVREDLSAKQLACEDVDMILDASSRAARLTSQLLAFSRRQVQSLRVINLNTIVLDIEHMLRRLIGEDVNLAIHLAPDLALVKVDPTHIEQVIVNLVVNARDAMPNGGRLTIETANAWLDEHYGAGKSTDVPPGAYAMLAVTDTGHGMDEEIRQQIFEPFFTTKGKEGTGLGLSTVFGIVKQSGGFIWVYSELDQGSSFKVYLPSVVEPLSGAPPRHPTTPVLTGTETVLVVEDEAMVRKAVCRILNDYGYTVLEAEHAEDALRIATEYAGTIHLMLSDVVMPDSSGPALAEALASARPAMKVIYMSGYPGHALVHRARLEEGTAFVQKPFSNESLLSKLREALDEPASRRSSFEKI